MIPFKHQIWQIWHCSQWNGMSGRWRFCHWLAGGSNGRDLWRCIQFGPIFLQFQILSGDLMEAEARRNLEPME